MVNGHSFILICQMATLVRRALAEVRTVPVLITFRQHHSNTDVDEAYRYTPSSVVCLSVCNNYSEPCNNP